MWRRVSDFERIQVDFQVLSFHGDVAMGWHVVHIVDLDLTTSDFSIPPYDIFVILRWESR